MSLTAPLPPDYPNRLVSPAPDRAGPQPAWRLVAALIVLCLIPRIWMAWRVDTLCPDAVLYIELAQALERGEFGTALAHMHLNTYPAILATGHRLGLDYQTWGEMWGVLAATLAVWPLFNWMRRQFDDRVALVGGVLYAVHPKLIEWSPELIRDSTFWLLLACSLDWLWRAVVEVRLRWFLAAGTAMTLCVLTRFEGLFLVFPVIGWVAVRAWSLREARRRLWIGALVCLAACPAVLLLVNVGLLAGHPQFEAIRTEPWERAELWLQSWLNATDEGGKSAANDASLGELASLFGSTLLRGVTPLFALLMLVGYIGWRRTWDRRDHLPLFLFTVAVALGIWIHLWFAHLASSRYALSIVIVSARCAALGLLGVVRGCVRLTERSHAGLPRWAPVAPVVAVALFGCFDAMSHYDRGRAVRADLGRWIRSEVGPHAQLVCTDDLVRVVGYYADARTQAVVPYTDGQLLIGVIQQLQPQAVALTIDRLDPDVCQAVVSASGRLGLIVSDWGVGLPTRDKMLILIRPERRERVVHLPAVDLPGQRSTWR
ncbi:MAG: glycosyltransferase family 39 protein [Pirellulales bacterium]|nr:glycosyltransferase family 39 protein [Pirellulales bacterium]